MTEPSASFHYELLAYVARDGERPIPETVRDPLATTMTLIRDSAPSDCRFAVVRPINVLWKNGKASLRPASRVAVLHLPTHSVMWLVDTPDAAVMKAIMCYDHQP